MTINSINSRPNSQGECPNMTVHNPRHFICRHEMLSLMMVAISFNNQPSIERPRTATAAEVLITCRGRFDKSYIPLHV